MTLLSSSKGAKNTCYFSGLCSSLSSFCTTACKKEHGLQHTISIMQYFSVHTRDRSPACDVCVRDEAVHVLRAHPALQLFPPCAFLHAWLPLLSVVECIKACDSTGAAVFCSFFPPFSSGSSVPAAPTLPVWDIQSHAAAP